MKRFILFAITVLIFQRVGLAQSSDDYAQKFAVGFNYGYSYPVGSFAIADQSKYPMSKLTMQDTNRLGGYAKYGFHYEFYASYRFSTHFGIMVSFSGNDIGYNQNTLNAQYDNYFPPGTVGVSTGDNYYILQYLIGPTVIYPIHNHLSFEGRVLAGYTSTNYPTLAFYGSQETTVLSFPQGSGFGYNIGAGIKYAMDDGLFGVHLNITYAGSNVNFSNYTIAFFDTSNNYLGSSTYNDAKSLSVGLLQVTFGVTLEF